MATEYKLSYTASEIDKKLGQIDNLAAKDEIPTKTSQLTNDSGFITGYTETDPTVPSWAKQASKPSYTASEVGALPNTTKIPSKTSDLTNDSGYITGYTETDPTVPAWAKNATKPSYSKGEVGLGNVDNVKQYSANNPPPYPVTSVNGKVGAVTLDASAVGARPSTWMPSYSDVGAEKSGTAAAAVSSHNTSTSAHNDIRLLVDGLSSRVNALANSTDEDLDQMAEIVAYIKNNKTLIDNVTTSKVNVTDIINNLTTNVSNKPLSAAQGVALKALIDVLENDKLDASTLSTAISTALAQAKASGEFDGKDGEDAYTPVRGVDYYTESDKAEFSAYIASELAKRGQLKPEFAQSLEWLEVNGDTTKLYVLPDGYIYGYVLATGEPEPLYTNKLDTAEIKTGQRYSKSGAAFKAQSGCDSVVFDIPTSGTVIIRLRNCTYNQAYPQVYGGKSNTNFTSTTIADNASKWNTDSNGDQYIQFTNSNGDTHVVVMVTSGYDKSTAIITVNEEIKWSEGGTGYKWENTGHAFVPADYENRILEIETDVTKHGNQIANLEKKVENINADASITAAYDRIKRWKYPIYENAPVFLLETNKAALSGSFENTNAVYAKYDALMAEHPHYITRENCGVASDGTTPIYVYHFAEPTPHAFASGIYLETKPAVLVCSGVHPYEIAGVYCMYYAMEEITTNPELLDLRRNLHFVIMPMINPTAFSDSQYGMRNPDGIQVHYNFEVDHGTNGAVQGDRNYGGASPLSIPETQYFDALMNRYKDTLACVLSCHNNEVDEKYGTGFIWCSCATDYMVNLGNRFIDKMSAAWLEKHGNAFTEGIRWANDYAIANAGTGMFFDTVVEQPSWDYRVGRASVSGSGGTEYKQAIKYGVHGANVEVCPRCLVLDRNYNSKYTANVMTMGAETYINYFRTFMAAYDPKNKKDYAPNLPWSE